jgi:hypothetical protein
MQTHVRISLIGAASAFGATGAAFALLGLGVPFLLAALGASACVGLVLFSAMPRDAPTTPDAAAAQVRAAQARIDAIEQQIAGLRHDLRGALSPALIMSDRLVDSTDPAIRRAGEAVVRSIEKAAALLAASKAASKTPADAAPPPKEDAA